MSKVNKEGQSLEPIKKASAVDWSPYLYRPGIYHWRYFDAVIGGYYEHSLEESNNLKVIPPKKRCIEVELSNFPVTDTKDFEYLIREYFLEAFEDWVFHDSARVKDFFAVIIIPKNIYHQILIKINEFELLHIKDLLLEVIAISQHIITHELPLWDTPEYRRMRATAQSETEKAINVVERSGVAYNYSKYHKFKPKNSILGLSSITFRFNDKTSIKIQHKGLAEEFVEHLMRYYDELKNKDWRKDLATYPEKFGESHLKESFQKQIILGYYNLFRELKMFESSKRNPSLMMRFIACMLEFSLSPVGEKELGVKKKTEFRKGKNVSELLRQIQKTRPR